METRIERGEGRQRASPVEEGVVHTESSLNLRVVLEEVL
jgi:hypothetical protein